MTYSEDNPHSSEKELQGTEGENISLTETQVRVLDRFRQLKEQSRDNYFTKDICKGVKDATLKALVTKGFLEVKVFTINDSISFPAFRYTGKPFESMSFDWHKYAKK